VLAPSVYQLSTWTSTRLRRADWLVTRVVSIIRIKDAKETRSE
jgi:hypothetical protein